MRRGVPHLIDDYAPTTGIWTRALPLLLVAYAVVGLNALDLNEWSWQRNVLAVVVVLAVLAVGWAVTNLVRHRAWFARPTVLGWPELATFLIGPAVPSLIFGQWGDAFQALWESAVVLVAIYVITSYGVIPLIGWGFRRSVAQIGSLGRMVSRALPLLLLFTMFLFLTAELWQVAGNLHGIVYVGFVAMFVVLGAVFVVSRVPAFMTGLNDFTDWAEVRDLTTGTPAESIALPSDGRPPTLPLSVRQKANIGLVSLFGQAVQITFVAVLLTAFFVVLGFMIVPAATVASWTLVTDVHVLAHWNVGGRTLQLTEPLLRVSVFLGAFTGMYFTVVLSTDALYREEFADDVGPQIRQALAVRLAARHGRSDDDYVVAASP